MKKLFTLATVMLMVITSIFAQDNVTTVTFTGEQQNKAYQKLDSVLVTNLTQDWSEVVYYPDTLILLSNVGITDYESRDGKVHLYQNIPNPFHGITNFNLSLGNKEKVDMVIYDISGRKVAEYHNTLPSGEHQFRAAMDIPQTYLLSAVTKSGTTSIKMINLSNTGEKANIELISSLPLASDYVKKESIHGFKVGDEMQYVAYATQNDGVKDVTVKKAQTESETITFVFPNESDVNVTVTTGNAANIETTSATLAGTYEVKNAEVKEAGFEYKVSTASSFEKITSTNTISPFTADVKDLTAGTEYTYKAYVKTAEDAVYYGEEKTFTTEKTAETKVYTDEPTGIESHSATFHGHYTLGSESLTEVGFEVKKADGKDFETVYSSKDVQTPFEYTYSDKMVPATKYICRAYAVTPSGVYIFGNEVTFTTGQPSPELPVVRTDEYNIDYFNGTKALLYGSGISDGYCAMEEYGFYLAKTEKPQDGGQKYISDGEFSGFKVETDILEPATTYYFVAFATNKIGTAYGDVLKFETRKAGVAPILAVENVVPYATSAQISCSVKHPDLAVGETEEPIIEKGICYSEKENPTIDDTKVAADNDKIEDFVVNMSDLKEKTTYYVRAYAQVLGNVVYSEQKEVTTIEITKPEVQTVSVDKVGSSTATVTSKLTVIGGSEDITLGVRVFNEELNYDVIVVSKGALNADNTFVTNVNSLEKETTYKVQAYAKNKAGEAFGEVIEFTTKAGFACGDVLVDVDGNGYTTVQIGDQCWMSENLRVKHYADGRELSSEWKWDMTGNDLTTTRQYAEITNEMAGKEIWPKGSEVFYNWSTAYDQTANGGDMSSVIGPQGICPDGWHLPALSEYRTMFNTIDSSWGGGTYAYYSGTGNDVNTTKSDDFLTMRLSTSEGYWDYWYGPGLTDNGKSHNHSLVPNTPGYVRDNENNESPYWNTSGFNAYPAGYINKKGAAGTPESQWMFNATLCLLTANSGSILKNTNTIKIAFNMAGPITYSYSDNEGLGGYSVRCVMDPEPTLPVVETKKADMSYYDEKGVILNGSVVSDGFAQVSEYGFYYSKDADPTTKGEKLVVTNAKEFQYTLSNLDYATTYYYAAFATNKVGTAFGAVNSFTTPAGAACGSTIKDIDGNSYNTVQLGNQCWMAENLRTTKFADGTDITLTASEMSNTESYRYIPDGKEENVEKYGYLYNWNAVMKGAGSSEAVPSGVQGICPDGWHVPSNAEYLQMLDYVASVDAYVCERVDDQFGPRTAAALCSNEFWISLPTPCTPGGGVANKTNNATGFGVVPAGKYYTQMWEFNSAAHLWTATHDAQSTMSDAQCFDFEFGTSFVQGSRAMASSGFSVRCLKN